MSSFISPEQTQKAKEMDALTYLINYEPYELVKLSAGNYCTKTHDSLKLSNGKWYWWSKGIGGRSAVDYLMFGRFILPYMLYPCIYFVCCV